MPSLPRAALLALVVGACASVPSSRPPIAPAMHDEPFAIDGRLSARHGDEAISVAFAWTHASPRDEFVVTTPLGLAVAELTGDTAKGRVEVRTADGRHEEARDWETLTQHAVGVALPIGALASWARGAARADAPHTVEHDSAGRASVLRQDGCEIAYVYVDGATRWPSRLSVVCHGLEMRIVIDRWRSP